MSSTIPTLGHCLQGVQHVGVTVEDLEKSLEFYIDVLGGKLVVGGEGLVGDVLHNTLFQKEELDALMRGVSPRTMGIPDIRDGLAEVLDVRFISFGNTVVELLHVRDGKGTPKSPNWTNGRETSCQPIEKTCVAYPAIFHLSFHVKDHVDLGRFAQDLEAECQRRGISFKANRIVKVHSEEERRHVAHKFMANRFWNDPENFVEGYSDSDFGDFTGWALFYAKGPNGEQLEFNQVSRRIKGSFLKAQQAYNEAWDTAFQWPGTVE